MTIGRSTDQNGAIHDEIRLTQEENNAVDRCHRILRKRFKDRGELYGRRQRELCEWWLLGLLRFEGTEKMIEMAKNAQPHPRTRLIYAGYTTVKIEEDWNE